MYKILVLFKIQIVPNVPSQRKSSSVFKLPYFC